MIRIVLSLIVFMTFVATANANYYKCVTSNGKILFADSPPAEAKCEFKEKINSFSESPGYINSMRDEADYQIQRNDEKRAIVAEENKRNRSEDSKGSSSRKRT